MERQSKIITITDQKGGVGKTTTSGAMAAGFTKKGFKVLALDLDPQCNLSSTVKADKTKATMRHVFNDDIEIEEAIQPTSFCDFIQSDKKLDKTVHDLDAIAQVYKLKTVLESIAGRYDYIIIDTPPALSPLTINALVASNSVIIPVQADSYSMQGAEDLARTIKGIKSVNKEIEISGILITRYKARAALAKHMTDQFEKFAEILNSKVFNTKIREAIAVQESQLAKTNIFDYEKSNVAEDYKNFIEEYLRG